MSRVDSLLQERIGGLSHATLMIASAKLTDAELAQILADPRVPPLTDLSLHNNRLTVASVKAIAASPKTAALAILDLSSNPIGDAGLAAVPKATVLYLANVGATPEGIRAFEAEELDLGYQDVGVAAAVLASPRKRLAVQSAAINGKGAKVLLAAGIESLNLKGNPIGPGGLAGLKTVRVTTLDLGKCRLDAVDAAALASSESTLVSLNLDYNALGDDGLRALAGAAWLARLQFLSVLGTRASPAAREVVRAAWGDRPGLTIDR